MENNVDLYENFFLSLLKYENLLNNNKLHLNKLKNHAKLNYTYNIKSTNWTTSYFVFNIKWF